MTVALVASAGTTLTLGGTEAADGLLLESQIRAGAGPLSVSVLDMTVD